MSSSNSRTSSAQGLFETEMARAYSPNSQFSRKQWDPVLRAWRLSKAVQLFPPQHASMADAIFGEGAANEIYSPHNGLFLHEMVEHALKKGYIAIIPDGPFDFKVVVLDKHRREVHRRIARLEVDGFSRYIDLDERQLSFKTDARPKMRYVWWTYVNAVLQAFHFADCASDYGKIDHRPEVRWYDSYWTHHGPFVKRNQLKWFVKDGCGPCWTAAFLHGFQEEGDTLKVKQDLEHIFTRDHCRRQRSPVPDYEEIAPSDDEDTEERGHNGEVISRGNNAVVSLARATTNLQIRGDPNSSAASIYPSRTFFPPPPYSSNPPQLYPSVPPPSYPTASPPSYTSHPRPPPDLPASASRVRQVGAPRLMLTWRGNRNTESDPKTTRTMRTITTVKTSGDEYTARSEVIATTTTVTGDDEDEQREDGGQASQEDDTTMPRFRSGELVISNLANLTRFHLDPRAPKPGHEQVHLSVELNRLPDRFEVGDTSHTLAWEGTTRDMNGNATTISTTGVFLTTKTDGTALRTKVNEWTYTEVKRETDGENNRGQTHTETVFEEEIHTETVTTNGNDGR